MADTGYRETDEKLQIRILAHKKYANFELEEWLRNWLGEASGQRLLEIGCGNANFFPTYAQVLGERGIVLGMDLNPELLYKAREQTNALPTPSVLFPWNFDHHPWPLLAEEVDILIAPYSAYYTKDILTWVEDALRVIRVNGRLLILGPARNNAQELYELNELLSGIRSVPETDEATMKLEAGFLPELRSRLGDNITFKILDRQIVFPSPDEFARYYQATMLYDRTCLKLGRTIPFKSILAATQQTDLRLNKQVICIEGRKN
jgi:SAM-dependent methyltransferase